jgi:hypothetical protein
MVYSELGVSGALMMVCNKKFFETPNRFVLIMLEKGMNLRQLQRQLKMA